MTSETAKSQWKLTAITEALGDLQIKIEDNLTIGRGGENDLVLASKRVSRNHVSFAILADRLFVKDLGSSNGTILNEIPLEANKPRGVKVNDIISIAGFEFAISVDNVELDDKIVPLLNEQVETSKKQSKDEAVKSDGFTKPLAALDIVTVMKKNENETSFSEDVSDDMHAIGELGDKPEKSIEHKFKKGIDIERSDEILKEKEDSGVHENQEQKEKLENISNSESKVDELKKTIQKPNEFFKGASNKPNEFKPIVVSQEVNAQTSETDETSVQTEQAGNDGRDVVKDSIEINDESIEKHKNLINESPKAKHVDAPSAPTDPNTPTNWMFWSILVIVVVFLALMIF